MMVQGSTVEHN